MEKMRYVLTKMAPNASEYPAAKSTIRILAHKQLGHVMWKLCKFRLKAEVYSIQQIF